MYMMFFQQNMGFGRYNPFMMGCYNPRMNFFMGLAAATAGLPYYSASPLFSIFNPYMPMVYPTNYTLGGLGLYNYQAKQNYTYISQGSSTNPFSTQTNTSVNQGTGTTPLNPSTSNPFKFSPNEVGQYTPTNSSVKSKAFLNKVKEIAKRLNCNYKDLLGVMQSESSMNPKAVNKSTGATGLIQFMPNTAKMLGTTTAAIKNMSALEQLDYVEKYLQKMKKQAGFGLMEPLSGGQLYALVFLPGRAKREVLTKVGEKYYSWTDKKGRKHGNQGLDLNKDGKITKAELDARIKKCYVNENCFVA